MSSKALHPRYMGILDRGYGREVIEIGLDYPFHGSGVLIPPTIEVSIDLGKKEPPYYIKVIFLAVHSQAEFAKNMGMQQQDVSDCIARHKNMQKFLGRNEE
jgi:hypothetical protein